MILMKQEYFKGTSIAVCLDNAFSHECSRRFGDGTGEEWIDHLSRVGLLFLDDIDKMRLTDRVEWEFYALIDHRINRQLPTILTTNAVGKQLMDKFNPDRGPALVRRLKEFFTAINFQ